MGDQDLPERAPKDDGGSGAVTRTVVAVTTGAMLLSILAHLRVDASLLDDALITFRYAANLAGGEGLVYNAGERVLGTTTPAWAVILGLGGLLTGPEGIPGFARMLDLLLLVVTSLLAMDLTRRLTGSAWLAVGVATAYLLGPYLLFSSMSGMETPLFHLLVVGALSARHRERWTLMALAAGVSVLVRPEGIFVIAVFGLDWLVRAWRREGGPASARGGGAPVDALRRSAPTLAAFLLPGLVLGAALWAYYGMPVPHTIRAKSGGLYPLTAGQTLASFQAGIRSVLTLGGPLDLVGLGAFPVMAAGAGWLVYRRRDLWPVAALLVILTAFYATSRTLLFPHYYAMVEPFALVAWGAAFYAGGRWALERIGRTRGLAQGVLLAATLLFVMARPLDFYPRASVLEGRMSTDDEIYSDPLLRTEFYRAMAEVVGPALPAGTEVLLPEIGELGFRLPHVRVLDAAGLVSPEALPHLPVPPEERVAVDVGAVPTSLVRAERPEVVITLDLFARRSLYTDPWFEETYDTVWMWRHERLTWGPLRIHTRRDFAPGAAIRDLPGGVASTASEPAREGP